MMNKWMILLLSLALAGAAAGCSDDKKTNTGTDGGSDDAGDLSTSELITAAEGGEISLDDATLNIPAGALDEDTTITVDQLSSDGLPDEENVVGDVYDFGPDGTTFNTPVTLTLNGSDIPDNASIAFLNANNEWEALTDSEVGSGHVTATTTHFTKFAIVIVAGHQTAGSCSGTFTACGGELANTAWALVDSDDDCATVSGLEDQLLSQFSSCQDKTIAITASFDGTVAFDGNHGYTLDVAANIGGQITLAKSCLGGQCGADFEENQDGKCVSKGDEPEDKDPEMGSYAVGSGNVLTFTPAQGESEDDETIDYCITGSGKSAKLAVRVRKYSDETKATQTGEFRFHAVATQL